MRVWPVLKSTGGRLSRRGRGGLLLVACTLLAASGCDPEECSDATNSVALGAVGDGNAITDDRAVVIVDLFGAGQVTLNSETLELRHDGDTDSTVELTVPAACTSTHVDAGQPDGGADAGPGLAELAELVPDACPSRRTFSLEARLAAGQEGGQLHSLHASVRRYDDACELTILETTRVLQLRFIDGADPDSPVDDDAGSAEPEGSMSADGGTVDAGPREDAGPNDGGV